MIEKFYGVCVSDIHGNTAEDDYALLQQLKGTSCEDYLEEVDNLGGKDAVQDWLYDFENDGYFGLAAFLQAVIMELDGVTLDVHEDDSGMSYLGLSARMPWHWTNKLKNLTQEEFIALLQKYLFRYHDKDDLDLSIKAWVFDEE